MVEIGVPERFDRRDDVVGAVGFLGQLPGEIEVLGHVPGGVEVLGGLGNADHRAAPDTGAPSAGLPGGQGHELELAAQLGQVFLPDAGEPVGHDGGQHFAFQPQLVARRRKLRGVDGDAVRAQAPVHHVGDDLGVGVAVDDRPVLGVEGPAAGLQQQRLDGRQRGGPEVEQVPIRPAVAVEVLNHRRQHAHEIVPGLDLAHVDARLLDQVGAVAQQHGVDVVGQAEDPPAAGPGAERRRVDRLVQAFAADQVRQVGEADVFQRPADELGHDGAFDFDQVCQRGAGPEARERSARQGRAVDHEEVDRRALLGAGLSVVVFGQPLVELAVVSAEGPHL